MAMDQMKQTTNLSALAEEGQELECSGRDSGLPECWPTWVNVGVPVMCCVVFVLVLAIFYWKYESPPDGSTRNTNKSGYLDLSKQTVYESRDTCHTQINDTGSEKSPLFQDGGKQTKTLYTEPKPQREGPSHVEYSPP